MRIMSETKLAINNLYSRVCFKEKQQKDPLIYEKLAHIQDRVLDMSQVVSKVESFLKDEKQKQRIIREKTKSKKHVLIKK